MPKWMTSVGLVLMVSLVIGAGPLSGSQATALAAPQGASVAPESNDFATRVLSDAWDMSQFSDISAYLNDSGQRVTLQNIQVANGVFSAESVGDGNFALLFPGYQNAIKTGKDGALHPIDTNQYNCLNVAMDVQSNAFNQAQVLWFGDERLNAGPHWGQTNGIILANNIWKLYQINLATNPSSGSSWSSQPSWQGLRFDPTDQANTNFQIDWARLTDCSADNVNMSWGVSGAYSMWLRPTGTTRDILVKFPLNGQSTTLDVQGVQPGTYTIRLFNNQGHYVGDANNTLVINQAPIASFLRPSFTSGADFATQSGDAWDFSDAADVQSVANMQTSLHDSLLDMTTQSAGSGGNGDAQFFLNAAHPGSGSPYRYLSFRFYTDWAAPWQNVPDGMIARWIWGIQGGSGPTYRCYIVSHDIPYDVGWHVYNIDLWDPYDGAAFQSAGDCPSNPPNWHNTPPVLVFRFDPNENVTAVQDPLGIGGPFHQLLDWIKLSAMDQVPHGIPYELQLHLNRPAGDLTGYQFYYTTDRSNPTETRALRYSVRTVTGPFHIFLPMIATPGGAVATGDTFPSADLKFLWDTTSVSPNTYYICAVLSISPNTSTYCSDTPIQVY